MRGWFLTVLILMGVAFPLFAQDDAEQERIKRTTWQSAVLPGWGQVNNGKWWKVPLV